MRKSSRAVILDAGVAMLREGEAISLDSVAVAAGVTKPGLMYHFRTKEALMLGLVDHVVDAEEADLEARLGSIDPRSPWPRLAAYLGWMLSGDVDEADLAMLADPRLRAVLTTRWSERFEPWVRVPDGLDAATKARLDGARLMAEGAWFADATGVLALDDDARAGVQALAEELLSFREGDAAVHRVDGESVAVTRQGDGGAACRVVEDGAGAATGAQPRGADSSARGAGRRAAR